MVTISSDVIRGYNDTMILFLLKIAPSYGYEISKNIKALTSEKYVIKEQRSILLLHEWKKTGMLNHIPRRQTTENAGLIIVLPKKGKRIIMKNARSGSSRRKL